MMPKGFNLFLCCCLATLLLLITGCGWSTDNALGNHTTTTTTTSNDSGVTITASTASVAGGGTSTFSATVSGATDQGVIWSVVEPNGGSITQEGVYTAPQTAGTYHVRATSVADPSKSGTITVTVSSGSGGQNPYVSTNPGSSWTYVDSTQQFSTLTYSTVGGQLQYKQTYPQGDYVIAVLEVKNSAIYLKELDYYGTDGKLFSMAVYLPSALILPNQFTGSISSTSTVQGKDSSGATITTFTETRSFTNLGTETITVPAGTFSADKVRITTSETLNNTTETETVWLALGVGTIRQTSPGSSSELSTYVVK